MTQNISEELIESLKTIIRTAADRAINANNPGGLYELLRDIEGSANMALRKCNVPNYSKKKVKMVRVFENFQLADGYMNTQGLSYKGQDGNLNHLYKNKEGEVLGQVGRFLTGGYAAELFTAN